MGPLVYYARWHGYKLRLQGRDGPVVWGHFIGDSQEEETEVFRFNSRTNELSLGEGESRRQVYLDEMGVIIPRDADPTTSSSVVEP